MIFCYIIFIIYYTATYDWYPEDNTIREFDLLRHNPNPTVDEVFSYIEHKYMMNNFLEGTVYVSYLSVRGLEEEFWGYTTVEAVSVKNPPPASKQFPKPIEPGRLLYIRGRDHRDGKCTM